tara:strand:- start:196 stop:393 length:198 start_codon:yes stop_codon:yes gene_type:complete
MKLIMFLIIVLMIIMWHCKPMLMREISSRMMDMIKRMLEIGIIKKSIKKVKSKIDFVRDLFRTKG